MLHPQAVQELLLPWIPWPVWDHRWDPGPPAWVLPAWATPAGICLAGMGRKGGTMNKFGKWLLIPSGAQWMPVELSTSGAQWEVHGGVEWGRGGTGSPSPADPAGKLCRLIRGRARQSSQGQGLPGGMCKDSPSPAPLGSPTAF